MSADSEITTPGQLVARWGERAGEFAARAQRLGDCRAGEVAAGEAGAWRSAADELARALARQLAERGYEVPAGYYRDAAGLHRQHDVHGGQHDQAPHGTEDPEGD